MKPSNLQPMVEVTRGSIVESIHYGALAVVDVTGRLVASYGDPDTVTFLRSAAKPFQALPFVEHGGPEHFHLSDRELALMCSSHSGTDEHVAVVSGMQAKIGVSEADLMCGTHMPYHEATAWRLIARGEPSTPNRHNCSGKHTGMLAHALLRQAPKAGYIDFSHPVQRSILTAFAEMCGLSEQEVELGIDGCSAPNFAVPLRSAALAFARLVDPSDLPDRRAEACERIVRAMTANPDMVGGPARFDTLLMELAGEILVTKSGAEGYQALALRPGALGPGSPALGLALKISDGDAADRAKATALVEALRQLGALSQTQIVGLAEYGTRPVYNWRHIEAGEIHPAFVIEKNLA